jgi:hypothetical protein
VRIYAVPAALCGSRRPTEFKDILKKPKNPAKLENCGVFYYL